MMARVEFNDDMVSLFLYVNIYCIYNMVDIYIMYVCAAVRACSIYLRTYIHTYFFWGRGGKELLSTPLLPLTTPQKYILYVL